MITEEEISHQNNNFFDLSHPSVGAVLGTHVTGYWLPPAGPRTGSRWRASGGSQARGCAAPGSWTNQRSV